MMKTKSIAESQLDEEYPALSTVTARRTQSTPYINQIQQQPQQITPEQTNPWKEFEPYNINSPESFIQADLSPQDLGYALTKTLGLIPDAPYDVAVNSKPTPTGKQQQNNGYPKMPYLKLLQPEFFKKYDNQTLFFIFFYFIKTSQQYFAGCELKRRNWRFNTKYQTWFHRIGKPLEKTDQYEIGKFEYFDNESAESWCIRVRSPFKFEYQYMDE
ncbi:NOT2 / NOT3 / NOT5 family protein [Trichomonas vaginalis G3]|uniref:NOT2 / NOT3 / NOT5 family protein n=1 Tax=Trichomonas vaginalis (strain ATCC PRA-98 / G3) TaxID=412133 RepID=A2DG92_TRIV3|nr:nuclear-transcribed mRNA catabolic process, deadenylation-dependent decay [Trichomonas vaginalis G3]EAY20488.1 NOT2 / NOT3 / NOT5 family protein [Trichomonas vaginalis G3]KAI5488343.1 nuclear-transcribed mRNA catabolic process, deadenylation-dependent decay [Trichomonas vaginalis G3]|eukprot:XP_001581474.1 NOT2 / NOT3 / NOT5 family protein [Trichomonas vaginalis G3]